MNGLKYVRSNLYKLDRRTNIEQIRIELFSCITYILLSKDFFKDNDSIKKFVFLLDIDLKDYVYRSRTLICARINRAIEVADDERLHNFLDQTKKIVFDESMKDIEHRKQNSSKGERKNSIDELLSQFSRVKGE
ncbi:hypothetical protein [Bacillus subtilis]|uniref:hypothetical protein n=1 Tax=Bacillus subtilis TaxID=1423 RepID=UPI000C7660F5|nr:hypothetical protein [Bacillus subtilis]PLV35361.1 hypothetical protein BSP2_37930 [Bacillus subtilis subsp. subtilis]